MKVEPDHIWWVWFCCHIEVSHVIRKKMPTETQTESYGSAKEVHVRVWAGI